MAVFFSLPSFYTPVALAFACMVKWQSTAVAKFWMRGFSLEVASSVRCWVSRPRLGCEPAL